MRLLVLAAAVLAVLAASLYPATPVAAAATYFLPAPAGTELYVTQGNGDGNHNDTDGSRHAYDFAVAGNLQFPVAAARSGRVIGLRSDSTNTSCRALRCWTDANYVLVDHGDGTSALYLHLATGSVIVALGATVAQGEAVGSADTTGWTNGHAHLHFQVETTPTVSARTGWWWSRSRPISFSDPAVLAANGDGVPTVGGSPYASGNTPIATPSPTSAATPPTSWYDRTYTLDCGLSASTFTVRLTGGDGRAKHAGGYDRIEVQIQKLATGDLSGGGDPETAVLLWCLPDPSNFFTQEIQVFTSSGELLSELPEPDDRGGILPAEFSGVFTIADGRLRTGVDYYAPDGNHAEGPTIHDVITWRWDGSSFVANR